MFEIWKDNFNNSFLIIGADQIIQLIGLVCAHRTDYIK